MLNILIFSPFAVENGRGGEISSMELASGLQKYYNVTFIDTNRLFGKLLLSKKAIEEKLKGVKNVKRIKFFNLVICSRYFSIFHPSEIFKLYKQVKKNDIVYYSISDVAFDILFILFSLLHRNAKFIVGYRKPLHSNKLLSLYNIRYRLSILLYSIFKKRFYHHALSESTKNFLGEFYDPHQIKHIIHGISLDQYIDDSRGLKSSDTLKFIYIGYLDDIHKGVKVLAEAIEQLFDENQNLNIHIEFCGMGPLESKIKELENIYPKFLKFNGYISNELISEYYKKSDVFLFTSRIEPFPRSIMEALGANLVILSTKTTGSLEILYGKEFAFFIKELSPIAIKNKILELYYFWKNNINYFRELQEKARKYVFQKYPASTEVEMFKSFLDKISKY